MKQFHHKASRSIFSYGLILSSIFYLLVSCEREKSKFDPTEFLSESSVIVPNLTDEWTWISTMSGGWGSVINPETEGYIRSIVFTSQQKYIEITSNRVSLESYYRIDSTEIKSNNGKPIFKITYFDQNKIPHYLSIDQNFDTICLYLSDIKNCYDCSTTSIYRKY